MLVGSSLELHSTWGQGAASAWWHLRVSGAPPAPGAKAGSLPRAGGQGGRAGGRPRPASTSLGTFGKVKALGIWKRLPEGLRPSVPLTTAGGVGTGSSPHWEPGPPPRERLGKPGTPGVRGQDEGGPKVIRRP